MKYKRLKLIASLIKKDERVLDVGTDHAILPILLLKDNVTNNITASDLNKEPLEAAKRNLESEGLLNKVELKLMDGIKGIHSNDFDTIVIAGMGGITISNIINEKNISSRLLIHSTTDNHIVRKALMDNGMKIDNEWIVLEGKVYNIVIEASRGKVKLSKKELFMGPKLLEKVDPETMSYFEHLLNIFERNSELSKNKELRKQEREWIKEKLWNEKN